MKPESISLYFREGGSNKEYHASLEEKKGGWVVNFKYGRRNATLATGTKTSSPIVYDKAWGIYSKLVKSKTAKGYKTADGTVPFP